jgi:hypothetical protein
MFNDMMKYSQSRLQDHRELFVTEGLQVIIYSRNLFPSSLSPQIPCAHLWGQYHVRCCRPVPNPDPYQCLMVAHTPNWHVRSALGVDMLTSKESSIPN